MFAFTFYPGNPEFMAFLKQRGDKITLRAYSVNKRNGRCPELPFFYLSLYV